MLMVFHTRTDGQSEAVNKIITMYLSCLSRDHPRQWVHWLPWAEFCNNSAFQSLLRTSLFCVVYGRDPPAIPQYTPGSARVPVVDQQLVDRDEFLSDIRDRLEQVRQHYKNAYDVKHYAVEFQVGD
jgi:hypothetical protein